MVASKLTAQNVVSIKLSDTLVLYFLLNRSPRRFCIRPLTWTLEFQSGLESTWLNEKAFSEKFLLRDLIYGLKSGSMSSDSNEDLNTLWFQQTRGNLQPCFLLKTLKKRYFSKCRRAVFEEVCFVTARSRVFVTRDRGRIFDCLLHREETRIIFKKFRKYLIKLQDRTSILMTVRFDLIVTDAVDILETIIDR